MQTPPAYAAEPAHHAIGRGRGQRSEPNPGNRSHYQVNAMRDLMDELARIVALIGKKTTRDVRQCSKRYPRRAFFVYRQDYRIAESAGADSPPALGRETPSPRSPRGESTR